VATALHQVKSANGSSGTTIAVGLTSTLAGSVLWVFSASGNVSITLGLPTDSASQTYANIAPQVNNTTIEARMDHILSTASGVTTVTGHANTTTELSCTVQELTGTSNTLDSSVPTLTQATAASLATGSITTAAGSIIAAGVTDGGSGTTAYSVSPAAYTIDGLTPNGANERIGSASAANVASGAHVATFTAPASAQMIVGQAAYAAGAGGGASPFPLPRPWISRPWTRPVLAR
jgi:hypothetical protein